MRQLNGTEAPLRTSGSLSFELDGSGAGKPLLQLMGEEADTKNRPYNLMPMNEGADRGVRQLMGEMADLSRTPDRGYETGTPMSERSWKQGD